MYCRGADAVILTYDVTNWQSLAELEDRFLAVTDTAKPDCIFAIVGNKADLTDDCALFKEAEGDESPVQTMGSPRLRKQVHTEDAIALYKRILKYKMLEEKDSLPAEKMCFETSAKTGCGPWFRLLSLGCQECDAASFSVLRNVMECDFGSNQESKTLLRKKILMYFYCF
ncbi:ras-related protein Rab-20-like, partial [Acipenser oxyrinchus oxyrinchus]